MPKKKVTKPKKVVKKVTKKVVKKAAKKVVRRSKKKVVRASKLTKRQTETQAMLTYIAKSFGALGVEAVELDGVTIATIAPEELPELVGYGDTLVPGDVFTMSSTQDGITTQDVDVYRLERIHLEDEDRIGLLAKRLNAPEIEGVTVGPTSMLVKGNGWQRHFTKVPPATQAQG